MGVNIDPLKKRVNKKKQACNGRQGGQYELWARKL